MTLMRVTYAHQSILGDSKSDLSPFLYGHIFPEFFISLLFSLRFFPLSLLLKFLLFRFLNLGQDFLFFSA